MPTRVSFVVDEHVPKAVVRGLKQRGVDAIGVPEVGMRSASDLGLLAFARSVGRAVFTQDEDFLRLHAEGQPHSGIVFARQGVSIGDVIRGLQAVAEAYSAEDLAGRVESL